MNEVNLKSLDSQREWLDHFYKDMYLQIGFGPRQNRYYMEQIILGLNQEVRKFLEDNAATVIDVGCAMGYGTIRLLDYFPQAIISGIDVSECAITAAKKIFPGINFIYEKNGDIESSYDIVISSHCLEHYLDPIDMLLDLLAKTNRYCIILAPYMEFPLGKTHLSAITDNTFSERIEINNRLFIRIYKHIFDGDTNFSRAKNILVIYRRQT